MKKLAVSFALLAMSAFAGDWTGYISESKCGASHADGSQKSIDCVAGCIKSGAKPVLVTDGKVVKIANGDKVPAALYGKKVSLKGTLSGDTVTVESVAAAK
jgi:hypothetical protein